MGICHRDLKFENCLKGEKGRIYVADFGLGAVSQSPDKTFFTCKTTCGSPHYLAVEVIDSERYDGKKADIWSLGIMFYTMLAFKFPFAGSDVREIFENSRKGNFLKINCSPEAWDLINMMIVPDPEKRASWEDIFSSDYIKKYSTSTEDAITIGDIVVPYRPTTEK